MLFPGCNVRLMLTSSFLHACKTRKTVCYCNYILGQEFFREPFDLFLAETLDSEQLHVDRTVVIRGFDCCNKGCLAGCTTPPLFARTLATQIRVIHLNATMQLFFVLTLKHDLYEFMGNFPCGRLANSQTTREFNARNAAFSLAEMVHRLEPSFQRQFRRGENCAGRNGGLTPAPRTLEKFPRSNDAVFTPSTVWALEAIGPAQFHKGSPAFDFGPVKFVKLWLTNAFLKLDIIARYFLDILQPSYPTAGVAV